MSPDKQVMWLVSGVHGLWIVKTEADGTPIICISVVPSSHRKEHDLQRSTISQRRRFPCIQQGPVLTNHVQCLRVDTRVRVCMQVCMTVCVSVRASDCLSLCGSQFPCVVGMMEAVLMKNDSGGFVLF